MPQLSDLEDLRNIQHPMRRYNTRALQGATDDLHDSVLYSDNINRWPRANAVQYHEPLSSQLAQLSDETFDKLVKHEKTRRLRHWFKDDNPDPLFWRFQTVSLSGWDIGSAEEIHRG